MNFSSSAHQVSETQVWDSRLGKFVSEKTWEAFDGYPDPATIESGNEYDVRYTLIEGKYQTAYRVAVEESGQFNFVLQSTLSTEPLTTHPLFSASGPYALNAEDLATIKQAESSGDWNTPDFINPEGPNANLYAYGQLALKGIDSYLNPSITLHVTRDETTMPSLSQIGKIADLSSLSGLPALPTGANWLLAGVTSESIGNTETWRNSYEYRASGIQGWNATLYSAS